MVRWIYWRINKSQVCLSSFPLKLILASKITQTFIPNIGDIWTNPTQKVEHQNNFIYTSLFNTDKISNEHYFL